MPTYEYLCEKCQHEFEREQRISDPPVKTCPKCRARKVTRLISRTSFVLKGGGWYSDLYSSSKSDKAGATSEGKSGSGGEAGASESSGASTPAKDDSKKSKKSDSKPSASKKSAA